jgi:hypothetical protein
MRTRLIFFIVAVLSLTISPTSLTSNAAPNPIEIISIAEVSCTSVEILFDSNVPKKSLSYYVINAVVDYSVGVPKNIKKVIKTKATGLITAEIKNLNPKAIYNFSVSAKTNKGKMISSKVVKYSSVCNLMDMLSNLPADWGNPKPIQLPTAAPVVLPAFTLTASSETLTVNTAATGFTINSTGSTITSFAINATPPNMSFNTTTGALSGTPNTVAGATAYTITATNTSGSATQKFTLTVTVGAALKVAVTQASVGSSPGIAFTTQPQITIQDLGGNTITSSTAVVTATVSTGGTLVGTATATASSGVAIFSNLGIRGYRDTAYTITYTAAGLTTATQSVTPSALIVGNSGPGGGKIFYVATSTGFNCGPTTTEKCYYLEAAPTTDGTTNKWTDVLRFWSADTNNNKSTSVPNARGIVIGTGYKNSLAIVAQSGNVALTSAAVAASEYRGPNNLTDWYLPSKDELNQMCKWQRGVAWISNATVCEGGTINTGSGAAGFVATDYYWSSSEWLDSFSYFQHFVNDPSQGSNAKGNPRYVRPVRAF